MSFNTGIVLVDVALNENIIYAERKQLYLLKYFNKLFHFGKEKEMDWIVIKDIPNAELMRRIILNECGIEIDLMHYILEDIEDLFQCYRFLCLDINVDILRHLDIQSKETFDFLLNLLKEFDLIHDPPPLRGGSAEGRKSPSPTGTNRADREETSLSWPDPLLADPTIRPIIKHHMILDYDLNNLPKDFIHYLCQDTKPINHRIISCSNNNIIKICDMQNKIPHSIIEDNGINCITSSSNGSMFAISDNNSNVKIYNTYTYSLLSKLKTCYHRIHGLDFSPDNQSLAICGKGDNCSPMILNIRTNKLTYLFTPNKNQYYRVYNVFCCKYSPNGKFIASVNVLEVPSVYLFDTVTTKIVRTFKMMNTFAFRIDFSPDNSIIASIAFRKIYVWNTYSGELLHEIGSDDTPINLTFSPDGSKLVILNNHDLKVYDIKTFHTLYIRKSIIPIMNAIFLPDGLKIILSCNDPIIMCDSITGQLNTLMNNDGNVLNSVIFTPIFSPIDTKLLKYQAEMN